MHIVATLVYCHGSALFRARRLWNLAIGCDRVIQDADPNVDRGFLKRVGCRVPDTVLSIYFTQMHSSI